MNFSESILWKSAGQFNLIYSRNVHIYYHSSMYANFWFEL